jgi:hypothetical protein
VALTKASKYAFTLLLCTCAQALCAEEHSRRVPEIVREISDQLQSKDLDPNRPERIEALWRNLKLQKTKSISLATETRSITGLARWIASGELAQRDFPEIEREVESRLKASSPLNIERTERRLRERYSRPEHLTWWHGALLRAKVPEAIVLSQIEHMRSDSSIPILESCYEWKVRRAKEHAPPKSSLHAEIARTLAAFGTQSGFESLSRLWESVDGKHPESPCLLAVLGLKEWEQHLQRNHAPAGFANAVKALQDLKSTRRQNALAVCKRIIELYTLERTQTESEQQEFGKRKEELSQADDDSLHSVFVDMSAHSYVRMLADLERRARKHDSEMASRIRMAIETTKEEFIPTHVGWNSATLENRAWFLRELAFPTTALHCRVAAVGSTRIIQNDDYSALLLIYRYSVWRDEDREFDSAFTRLQIVESLKRAPSRTETLFLLSNMWGMSDNLLRSKILRGGLDFVNSDARHQALIDSPPRECTPEQTEFFSSLKLCWKHGDITTYGELSLDQKKKLKTQLEVFGFSQHFDVESAQRFRESDDLEKWRRVRSIHNRKLTILIDASSHEIVEVMYPQLKVDGKPMDTGVQLTEAEAVAASRKLADKILPGWIAADQNPDVEKRVFKNNPVNADRYLVVWPVKYHGYKSLEFHCNFIWYLNGTFNGFCLDAPPIPPQPQIKVKVADANRKALSEDIWSNLGPKYRFSNPELTKKESELLWVGPRPWLELPAYQYDHRILSKTPRLAWVIEIQVLKRGKKEKAQVWIDCEDGQFLGGYLP